MKLFLSRSHLAFGRSTARLSLNKRKVRIKRTEFKLEFKPVVAVASIAASAEKRPRLWGKFTKETFKGCRFFFGGTKIKTCL